MRVLGLALVGMLLVVLAAMTWQHLRYLNKRRAVLQDRQPLLYSEDAFHALTFLRIEPGQDLLAAVRAFRDETQNLGGAQWVYAGKSIITGNASSQIGPVDWNAVVLAQYPSRERLRRSGNLRAVPRRPRRVCADLHPGVQAPRHAEPVDPPVPAGEARAPAHDLRAGALPFAAG